MDEEREKLVAAVVEARRQLDEARRQLDEADCKWYDSRCQLADYDERRGRGEG
jgi:hypothetical protein